MGSKRKLLPYLLKAVMGIEGDVQTILDGFSGTTRVAQAFSQAGYRVLANDVAPWSYVFGQCYLLNQKSPSYYKERIKHLNNLSGEDGWFTQHYGGRPKDGNSVGPDGKKCLWQRHNTRKLDAIRPEIDNIAETPIERSVLLTSLILALDRVDNTVGHQAAYLKEWSSRSYNDLKLEVPNLLLPPQNHEVFQQDIFELLPQVEADVAYYDPPYGSANQKMPASRVRYAAYYHAWKTICLNDRPEVWGAANRRADTRDTEAGSVFEEFRTDDEGRFLAVKAIKKLLEKTAAPHIILSYSNQGRATKEQLEAVIDELGFEYKLLGVRHKANVMAQMTTNSDWVDEAQEDLQELFFVIHKG